MYLCSAAYLAAAAAAAACSAAAWPGRYMLIMLLRSPCWGGAPYSRFMGAAAEAAAVGGVSERILLGEWAGRLAGAEPMPLCIPLYGLGL